jgi:exopolyphosphatase/guanosine-5'-triphosphate,3'-diphosphate pyrophosphatase
MSTYLLRETILTLGRRYDFEEGHSLQDERLALRLFDETARLGLHRLSSSESLGAPGIPPRDILSFAALLHDIGYVEGYDQHHKTAFRLITTGPIPGLSPREQTLVAHVARYHRGGTPDPAKHPAFAALPVADRELVEQLGAILRFADGLDRTHTDAVQDLRCELDGGRLIVVLLPGTGDEAERWAGQKKARWFEAVFGVQVVLA